MSISLYKLSAEYQANLEYILDNAEDLGQTATDTIEALEGELKIKMQAVAAFVLNLEAETKATYEASEKMKQRAQSLEKKQEALKQYLLMNMEMTDIKEIKCSEFHIKVGKCAPSLIIDNDNKVPEIYFNSKIVMSLDKKAIKEAINKGEKIEGCHLENKSRLIIK